MEAFLFVFINVECIFLKATEELWSSAATIYLFCRYPTCQWCLLMPRVTRKQEWSHYINDWAGICNRRTRILGPCCYRKHDPKSSRLWKKRPHNYNTATKLMLYTIWLFQRSLPIQSHFPYCLHVVGRSPVGNLPLGILDRNAHLPSMFHGIN